MNSNIKSTSKIGVDIGIGIPNQSIYRYSVNIKYKNTINTEENVEIKILGVALNIMEIKDVTERDAPTATIKYGIILLIRNFIL